ncbi:MAG: hypothetical protein JO116_09010 [Planctomycetaceae bacterium]|nr:hypothetical protein [Planctomycetaceae bacterium]
MHPTPIPSAASWTPAHRSGNGSEGISPWCCLQNFEPQAPHQRVFTARSEPPKPRAMSWAVRPCWARRTAWKRRQIGYLRDGLSQILELLQAMVAFDVQG